MAYVLVAISDIFSPPFDFGQSGLTSMGSRASVTFVTSFMRRLSPCAPQKRGHHEGHGTRAGPDPQENKKLL